MIFRTGKDKSASELKDHARESASLHHISISSECSIAAIHRAEKTQLDVNEVIREALALAGHELQKKQGVVEWQLSKTRPLVLADRVQLQQILLNLIMNGIEAMTAVTDRRRVLWMQSQGDESGEVLVAVRDSGTGLGSESGRLFTPFFTTKANGLAMGLSICRSLVENHNGRLWVTPNSPHGTVFSFTLPAAGESAS